jgi:hypothetical protein
MIYLLKKINQNMITEIKHLETKCDVLNTIHSHSFGVKRTSLIE